MRAQPWTSLGHVYVAPAPGPSERSFGLIVGGALVAAGFFSWWRGHHLRAAAMTSIGIALAALGLAAPKTLEAGAALWSKLGHALGWFNSRVVLGVFFFVVITPVGIVRRLLGDDALGRGADGGRWIPYPARVNDRRHYERLS